MRAEIFNAVLASGHKGFAAQVPFDPQARWSVVAQPLWPGRSGFPVHAMLNNIRFPTAIVA